MNYEKIELLLQQKGVRKMEFYGSINVTHAGFSKMIKNKTITVETLERIAAYFKVPASSFFDDSTVKQPTLLELQSKVSELYEENRLLAKENSKLKDEIRVLEKNSAIPGDTPIPKLNR